MVLIKITIDNSVRYIPKSEQTKEREIKPKKIKANSVPRKQNKNISQNSKKIPEKCCSKRIWIYYKIVLNTILKQSSTDLYNYMSNYTWLYVQLYE